MKAAEHYEHTAPRPNTSRRLKIASYGRGSESVMRKINFSPSRDRRESISA